MMKGNKICNAVLLRQALIKWRNLTSAHKLAATIAATIRPRHHQSTNCYDADEPWEIQTWVAGDVPPGHLPVYVGTNPTKRFVIRATYLNHPLFRPLLEKAEEEYGFHPHRRLHLPCDELQFQLIVSLLRTHDPLLPSFKLKEPLLNPILCCNGRNSASLATTEGSKSDEKDVIECPLLQSAGHCNYLAEKKSTIQAFW
eukprot:Gb_18131 [translate_table: standard]